MARPTKTGLDYFPHDTTTENDLEYIEAKHGLIGYAVFFKLLERIYDHGYYIEWSDRRRTLLAKRWQVDESSLQAVVDDCLEEGLFSEVIHKEHGVLTSKAVQRRYVAGCEKRKRIEFREEYLLIGAEIDGDERVTVVSGAGNDVNGAENPDNDPGKYTKQRKAKESKAAQEGAAPVDNSPGPELDDEFAAWLDTAVPKMQHIKHPGAFKRRVLEDPGGHPDLIAAFEEHQREKSKPPPRVRADPPRRCECGGRVRESLARVFDPPVVCEECGRTWVYDRPSNSWRAPPELREHEDLKQTG